MKQKEIRDLVKYRYAIDVTKADEHTLKTYGLTNEDKPIIHRLAISVGTYGINGLLFQECRYSNCIYAVIGNGDNLYRFL